MAFLLFQSLERGLCNYQIETHDLTNPGLSEYLLVKMHDVPTVSHGSDLAYCITTSGTTGVPKVVHVPHSCIAPNITHLR